MTDCVWKESALLYEKFSLCVLINVSLLNFVYILHAYVESSYFPEPHRMTFRLNFCTTYTRSQRLHQGWFHSVAHCCMSPSTRQLHWIHRPWDDTCASWGRIEFGQCKRLPAAHPTAHRMLHRQWAGSARVAQSHSRYSKCVYTSLPPRVALCVHSYTIQMHNVCETAIYADGDYLCVSQYDCQITSIMWWKPSVLHLDDMHTTKWFRDQWCRRGSLLHCQYRANWSWADT